MTRLAITLDHDLAIRTRKAARRNVSRYVSDATAMRLEEERLPALCKVIEEGCIANTERDLATCAEWRLIDTEAILIEEHACQP